MIVGPAMPSPITPRWGGASARAISSRKIAWWLYGRAGAAVLLRPGQPGVAGLVQLAAPVAAGLLEAAAPDLVASGSSRSTRAAPRGTRPRRACRADPCHDFKPQWAWRGRGRPRARCENEGRACGRRCARWNSIVRSEMKSEAAASRFVIPPATARATRSSIGVSSPAGPRRSPRAAMSARARSAQTTAPARSKSTTASSRARRASPRRRCRRRRRRERHQGARTVVRARRPLLQLE